MQIGAFINLPFSTEKEALSGLELYHKSGIDIVAFTLEYPAGPSNPSTPVDEIAAKVKQLGLETVVHAPFLYNSLLSIFEEYRKLSVRDIKLSIDIARRMESLSVTFHLGHISIFSERNDLYMKALKASLDEILDYANEKSVALSIENLPQKEKGITWPFPKDWKDFDHLLSLSKDIKLCLDTGHLCHSGVDVYRTLEKYARSTNCIHLHDFNGKQDHLVLGKGRLDIQRIFSILEARGFGGPVLLENLNTKDCLESFNKLKEMGLA